MTRILGAAALLLSSTAVSASVTIDGVTLANTVVTEFIASSGDERFDAVDVRDGAAPGSYGVASALIAQNADETARTDGRAEAVAELSDSRNGVITFESALFGEIDAGAPAGTGLNATTGGSFIYRFTLTSGQRFDLSYANVQQGSDNQDANAAIFSFTASSFLLSQSFAANTTGTANVLLPVGSYFVLLNRQLGGGSVRLDNAAGGGPLSATGTSFTSFTFAFTDAVPEPTAWAMMLGGFGLLGASVRRGGARREAIA